MLAWAIRRHGQHRGRGRLAQRATREKACLFPPYLPLIQRIVGGDASARPRGRWRKHTADMGPGNPSSGVRREYVAVQKMGVTAANPPSPELPFSRIRGRSFSAAPATISL